MANITEILGTDSVSSSRPVINSNFELLNDELASITALLDPTTSTLSNVASISTSALTLTSGGSAIASITTGGASFSVATTFSADLKISGKLIKNGIVGSYGVPSAVIAPVAITATTYFVENGFTLPAATAEGQEVTIINRSAAAIEIQTAVGVELSVTSIQLDGAPTVNATVTLRCFENRWYVIGSYGATIA
jgi:hypothetical protein